MINTFRLNLKISTNLTKINEVRIIQSSYGKYYVVKKVLKKEPKQIKLDSKFTAIDIGLNNPRNCCSFWPQLETVYFFVVDIYFIVTKHTAYFGQMMYVVNSKKLFSVSTFAP